MHCVQFMQPKKLRRRAVKLVLLDKLPQYTARVDLMSLPSEFTVLVPRYDRVITSLQIVFGFVFKGQSCRSAILSTAAILLRCAEIFFS